MEKYRPKYVREIVGNREAVERLQVISEEGNMPNIILSVSAPWPPWFHEEGFTCQDQISNGGSPLCGLDGAASRVWF